MKKQFHGGLKNNSFSEIFRTRKKKTKKKHYSHFTANRRQSNLVATIYNNKKMTLGRRLKIFRNLLIVAFTLIIQIFFSFFF